jgi:hypothetical protein
VEQGYLPLLPALHFRTNHSHKHSHKHKHKHKHGKTHTDTCSSSASCALPGTGDVDFGRYATSTSLYVAANARDASAAIDPAEDIARAANALWTRPLTHVEGAVAMAFAVSMYRIAFGRKSRGEETEDRMGEERIDGWMIDGHTGQAGTVKDGRVFKTVDR